MVPVPGVAEEHVLWRGAPCWRSLARHLCHARGIALYLGLVAAGIATASELDGATALETAATVVPFVAAGLATLAFLLGLAWRIARTTEYTLTTDRLILRFGLALPAVLAIPHRGIARASVHLHPDGTGDLPLVMKPGYHVAHHRAWPHARPWHVVKPQPMLRSVPGAAQLAPLLAQALAESATRHRAERHGGLERRPETMAGDERAVLQAAE